MKNKMSEGKIRDLLLDGSEPIRPVTRIFGVRPAIIGLLICWAVSRVLFVDGVGRVMKNKRDTLLCAFGNLTLTRLYSAARFKQLRAEIGPICYEGYDEDSVEELRFLNELEILELVADSLCANESQWLDAGGLVGDCASLDGDEADLATIVQECDLQEK